MKKKIPQSKWAASNRKNFINLWWPPELRKEVREFAYRKEVSIGRVIRQALYAYLNLADPELAIEEQSNERDRRTEKAAKVAR